MSRQTNIEGMTKIGIRAQSVGKAYRTYSSRRRKLKDILFNTKSEGYFKEYWALKDISFEVGRGDSLGVIGRNGSGKSTLLQLISGIVSPTLGTIQKNGKLAALLELGSGFNPEFTGIENIYLNASLLGLTKHQTRGKIDDILAFADIGEFATQPVKLYSSGMIVRLAFAVIANIQAEILIIDEALAVGDAFFVQKCMRFIRNFQENGCLIFVSHDASAVQSLCNKSILLEKGEIVKKGLPKDVIEKYVEQMQKEDMRVNSKASEATDKNNELNHYWENNDVKTYKTVWSDYRSKIIENQMEINKLELTKINSLFPEEKNYGSEEAIITKVRLKRTEENVENNIILGGSIVTLEIYCKLKADIQNIILGFQLKDDKGQVLAGENTDNAFGNKKILNGKKDKTIRTSFVFTMPVLPKGDYFITACIATGTSGNHRIVHWLNDALLLKSENSSVTAGLAGVLMQSIYVQEEDK